MQETRSTELSGWIHVEVKIILQFHAKCMKISYCIRKSQISEFKVVIFAILILFITFRPGSLFQNNVSISSEISLTFSNDKMSLKIMFLETCVLKIVHKCFIIKVFIFSLLYNIYLMLATKNFQISESHFMKIWWFCFNDRRILKIFWLIWND